ncbi:MAG: hypothetical protein KGM97_07875 [Alphaproteobacteria bacterium]|nr:hypothetical protein [Alphaproteobacteria bacterium]MDE2630892.1 hypothetical protein [Alphaproteobacteria bacterium]
MLEGSSLALSGTGFVLGVAALAFVERLYRVGFSRTPRLDSDPSPLRAAAEIAYEYARDNRLPLAAVAERRSGDAVGWFEKHMLKHMPVSATSVKSGSVEVLGAHRRARMSAVPGGIAKAAGGEPIYADPMVTARHFRTYVRWVRTVW